MCAVGNRNNAPASDGELECDDQEAQRPLGNPLGEPLDRTRHTRNAYRIERHPHIYGTTAMCYSAV
jgi:hypothetical protein